MKNGHEVLNVHCIDHCMSVSKTHFWMGTRSLHNRNKAADILLNRFVMLIKTLKYTQTIFQQEKHMVL